MHYRIKYLNFMKPRQRGRGCCFLKCQHIFGLYYKSVIPRLGRVFAGVFLRGFQPRRMSYEIEESHHYCGHHAITVPKLANMLFSPLVRMREPWTTTRASRLVIL